MSETPRDRGALVGATPIGASPKKRGPLAWLIPLVLAIIAVIILLLLLSRCGSGSDDSGATPATSTATAGTSPSATSSASTGPTAEASDGVGGSGATESGTITADGKVLLPLAGATGDDLSGFNGQTATTESVVVESVPADEGFWVGTSADDRVYIQLTGAAGESPFTVKTGDQVTFTGTVAKNEDDFAAAAGVSATEGAALLDAQGYHIEVARSALKLSS